ncbi:hypothetical protein K4F52_008023 [Lecanicillium sp. MT-2017a]|nr:hypothetical protein K4F52_008023 [Lecanicillium sp. MT-2017a]
MESTNDRPVELNIPWGIREQGLDKETVRVWTVSLMQYSAPSGEDIMALQAPTHVDTLSRLHRRLIETSSHRVIFLCGPTTKNIILDGIPPTSEIHDVCLDLGNCSYKAYLEVGPGLPRLYIYFPELSKWSRHQRWSFSRKMDMIIKFAIVITATPGARTGIFESASMLSMVLSMARDESRGGQKLTADNIDDDLRAVLRRKGIEKDSDIREIEAAAGCLTRGLLMLLHVLPRRPQGIAPSESSGRVDKTLRKLSRENKFDTDQFKKVGNVFKRAKSSREEEINRQLSLLPASTAEHVSIPRTEDVDDATNKKAELEDIENITGHRSLLPEDTTDHVYIPPNKDVAANIIEGREMIEDIGEQLPSNKDATAFENLCNRNPNWKVKLKDKNIIGNATTNRELAEAICAQDLAGMENGDMESDGMIEEQVSIIQTGSFYTIEIPVLPTRKCATGVVRASERLRDKMAYKFTPGSHAKAEWEQYHRTYGYRATCPTTEHGGGPVSSATRANAILMFGQHYQLTMSLQAVWLFELKVL